MKIERLINQNYEKLSQNDIHILKHIIARKQECHQIGINALAEKCNVSRTTILRLTKKLGFNGYSEFKAFLKWEGIKERPVTGINQRQLLVTSVNETLKANKEESVNEICHLIAESKRVFIFGTGRVQEICAEELKRMFLYVHKYLNVISGHLELKTLVPNLNPDDLIIFISLSGNTPDLIPIINQLVLNDVPFVSITSLRQNTLAQATPFNLYGINYDFLLYNNKNYESTLFLYVLTERLFYSYSMYINS